MATKQTCLISGTLLETAAATKTPKRFKLNRLGRPNHRLNDAQLKQAAAIITFDLYKQGRIRRWQCPRHGRVALSYRYQKSDGVHAWCEVPGCKKTTHFDEVHFQGSHRGHSGELETQEYENENYVGA
jgi:hypothetical protein